MGGDSVGYRTRIDFDTILINETLYSIQAEL